ncbi:hypothetical protein [Arthrobacter sp. MDT1-65]
MSLDASRSQVLLQIAKVLRMQREGVCYPVFDEQLRVVHEVLGEHLNLIRVEQLNGYLYGKDAA